MASEVRTVLELHPNAIRYVFGTAITPRGVTLGEILAGSSGKGVVRSVIERQEKALETMEESQRNKSALDKLTFLNQLAKLADHYKEAPFKSEAQRRKFYAMADRGEIAKKTVQKWEKETPKGRDLPERIEKAEKVEKRAGMLGMTGIGMSLLGRKASTKALGGGLFLSDYGIQAAKGVLPSTRAAESLRHHGIRTRQVSGMKQAAEDLIALQKEALEFREDIALSTDIPRENAGSDPYVKKNSLRGSSARTASHGAEGASKTSSETSAPGSRNFDKAAIVRAGLLRSLSKGKPATMRGTTPDAPEHLRETGRAMVREPAAGTAPHIQSGNV